MPPILKGDFDTALPTLPIRDFSGGLNTMEGSMSLASNECVDCQNVLGFPGRLIYVGGTNLVTPLPSSSYNGDGGIQFYDAFNAKHEIGWANGNMYDTVNGILLVIKSNIYTPGQNIGRTVLLNTLYWSTATVPMRYYDGSAEGPVITSGVLGSVPIPASDYLCSYAGSIIAANPNIGGSLNPGSLLPSNVNDPTSFIGANLTALGQNNVIKALIPMSVEAGGIPPTSSIMCVGSIGLVLAQGATNALKLNNVNYPIGCLDGNSVQYIPTGDMFGMVLYLGTDNQFHASNGITTKMLSSKILNLMNTLVSNAYSANPVQRFFATYNRKYHYYLCDIGSDVQMIYKWTAMADGSIRSGFFKIVGWPSGCYYAGTSGNGLPTNYVVANGSDAAGVYEVGLDGYNFAGIQPSVFFSTPYLHANDPAMLKEWQWVNLVYNNNALNAYTIDTTGFINSANQVIVANQIVFTTVQSGGQTGAIWNQSQWDQELWSGSPALPTQTPIISSKMLTTSVIDGLGNPVNAPLRSPAVSFRIGWKPLIAQSIASFDITALSTRYKPMGHYMAGGAPGSAESS